MQKRVSYSQNGLWHSTKQETLKNGHKFILLIKILKCLAKVNNKMKLKNLKVECKKGKCGYFFHFQRKNPKQCIYNLSRGNVVSRWNEMKMVNPTLYRNISQKKCPKVIFYGIIFEWTKRNFLGTELCTFFKISFIIIFNKIFSSY